MKKLLKQFKDILASDCLSQKEKAHLKDQFRNFIEMRDIISRKSLEVEGDEESDFSNDWILGN